MTKGAIAIFVKGLSKQLIPKGIRLNGVAPGRHIRISDNCLTDREKSVIIGHNRSSNPSGDLKTRVGGADRSTIFGRSVRSNLMKKNR